MIENYTPRAQNEVMVLANQVFGEGYFRTKAVIGKDSGSLLLLWRGKEGRLAGFVQGRRLPKNALRGFLDHQLANLPADIDAADAAGALGVVQAIAVDVAARRQGIGAKLMGAMHDDLVGAGADKLIVTFKRGASSANVDKLMSKLGFELWARLPSFWARQCDQGDFKCVDRDDRCRCEALLYTKAVFQDLAHGPLRGVRRAMAARMAHALSEVVPATVSDAADVEVRVDRGDITMRIMRAIAAACTAELALDVRQNSQQQVSRLHQKTDLGIAVDTQDGLFVPVLRDVGRHSAEDLREGLYRMRADIKAREIPPEELRGATITLSNFGMLPSR